MNELYERLIAFFGRYRTAFQLTFSRNNPSDIQVLAALKDYCFGDRSPFVQGDHDATMRNVGRQEVWHFIQRSIHLTPEEQYNLNLTKDKP